MSGNAEAELPFRVPCYCRSCAIRVRRHMSDVPTRCSSVVSFHRTLQCCTERRVTITLSVGESPRFREADTMAFLREEMSSADLRSTPVFVHGKLQACVKSRGHVGASSPVAASVRRHQRRSASFAEVMPSAYCIRKPESGGRAEVQRPVR